MGIAIESLRTGRGLVLAAAGPADLLSSNTLRSRGDIGLPVTESKRTGLPDKSGEFLALLVPSSGERCKLLLLPVSGETGALLDCWPRTPDSAPAIAGIIWEVRLFLW